MVYRFLNFALRLSDTEGLEQGTGSAFSQVTMVISKKKLSLTQSINFMQFKVLECGYLPTTSIRILLPVQAPCSSHNPLPCGVLMGISAISFRCFPTSFSHFEVGLPHSPVTTCWLFLVPLSSGPSDEPQLPSASSCPD